MNALTSSLPTIKRGIELGFYNGQPLIYDGTEPVPLRVGARTGQDAQSRSGRDTRYQGGAGGLRHRALRNPDGSHRLAERPPPLPERQMPRHPCYPRPRDTQTTTLCRLKAFSDQISAIDKQIDGILDRIVQSSVPTVISRFEERVRELEEEKLRLVERKAQSGRPASNYEDTLRTALAFLANPWNLWKSDRLEDRKKVLKLTFADRLRYERGKGFRTANLALPFKLLGDFSDREKVMARPKRFELLTS